MAKVTKRISMAMAVVFTAFAVLTSATPALAAKKKVVKKAKKKVVAVKKTTVKKTTTSAATASYNKALAAVKVAEGAFKYDMTNKDNVAYAKVKADLAQSAIDAVADNSAKAYLGARLAVVMNKIAVVEANLKTTTPAVAAKTVVSATSLTNTTVLVKFGAAQSLATAADYTFDNGLTVTNATVKQDDNTTVVLTTSSQDSTKTYALSYKGDSTGLTVKGLAVATTPSAIALSTSSTSGVIGANTTLTATVTPATAGVPVTFNIVVNDPSLSSVNPVIVKEVVTDAKGVAKFDYTRYYGGTDNVRVYPTGAPSIGDTSNVYWGSKARLTVVTTSTSTTPGNNGTVNYKATLLNKTGDSLSNQWLDIVFKENVNASGTTATVGGVCAYSRTDIGSNDLVAVYRVQTDSNGNASFTVTGSNTTATPIVYYSEANDLTATSKLKSSYLQVAAAPAVFSANNYTITCDIATGSTQNTTVSPTIAGGKAGSGATKGKIYTITVKKADGTPYAGGLVNVGFNELVNNSNTTINAVIASVIANDNGLTNWMYPYDALTAGKAAKAVNGSTTLTSQLQGATKVQLYLNSNGQACVEVEDPTANQVATPIIWIDTDNTNDNSFASGEPNYIAGGTLFVASKNDSSDLTFRNGTNDNTIDSLAGGSTVLLRARVLDQGGNATIPADSNAVAQDATITYTITNNGPHAVTIFAPVANVAAGIPAAGGFSTIDGAAAAGYTRTIPSGTTATINCVETSHIAAYFLGAKTSGTDQDANVLVSSTISINNGNFYSNAQKTVSFKSLDTVVNGATYTGTVADVNWGPANPCPVLLKLDNGDYIALQWYANDSYLQGPDLTNVSSISVTDFAKYITVGDRLQAKPYTVGGGTVWNFVNTDGSQDVTDLPPAGAAATTLAAKTTATVAAAVKNTVAGTVTTVNGSDLATGGTGALSVVSATSSNTAAATVSVVGGKLFVTNTGIGSSTITFIVADSTGATVAGSYADTVGAVATLSAPTQVTGANIVAATQDTWTETFGAASTSGTLALAFNDGTINKTISVNLLGSEADTAVASAVSTALNADTSITGVYTVSVATNTVTIKQTTPAAAVTANPLTITTNIVGGPITVVAAHSATGTTGSAAKAESVSYTVTATASAGTFKVALKSASGNLPSGSLTGTAETVTVGASDSASTIATAIAAALSTDTANFGAGAGKFTATATGSTVTITNNSTGASTIGTGLTIVVTP